MEPWSYEQTAYDSTQPRELKPAKPMEQRSFITRQMLKQKLEIQPVACGEYLVLSDFDDLRFAKANPDWEHISTPPLQMGWMGFANPMTWAMIAKFGTALFGFGFLVTGFVLGPILMLILPPHGGVLNGIMDGIRTGGVGAAIFLIPYFLLRNLLKKTNSPTRVILYSTGAQAWFACH